MRLNQITIPCTDYAASVAFYQVIGLTQIVDSPPRYARFECENGATLSLHATRETSAGVTIYFEVDDVAARVAELAARGIAIEEKPRQQSWLWYEAYVRDPAGNRVCIFHAGSNRRFPPWRIETGS